MTLLLELKNISKHYRKNEVLNDVNLKVQRNEIVGLSGINGSGKTTLLKVIIGMVQPNAGSIVITDDMFRDESGRAPKIGFSFKEFGAVQQRTGYKNMQIIASLFKDVSEDRLIELMDLVGLDFKDTKKVRDYSLGMKQRLSIAMSLVGDPKLIVWDEPDESLDTEGRQLLHSILKKMSDEKTTIIFSSHDQTFLKENATRIIRLNSGSICDLEEESIR